MQGRRCKACGRGNALSRHQDDTGTFKSCRYCGYERAVIDGKVYEHFPTLAPVQADADSGAANPPHKQEGTQ